MDRLRIGRAILTGARTHAELAARIGLAPGPLYHHLRTLERAGLVSASRRNHYELTPAGRTWLLLTIVMERRQRRSA
ncbi:MAG: winged helix-turn-helix domain-containing protein [Phycisphaerae bacterium]|nr:winged helix-turn-helix domain-containing protein [Phycisphaerae bacterium]